MIKEMEREDGLCCVGIEEGGTDLIKKGGEAISS